jgi:hypothetical protein
MNLAPSYHEIMYAMPIFSDDCWNVFCGYYGMRTACNMTAEVIK